MKKKGLKRIIIKERGEKSVEGQLEEGLD